MQGFTLDIVMIDFCVLYQYATVAIYNTQTQLVL